MSRNAKSVEELFPLIEYCKAGDLRSVAEWIKQGNPLNPPPGKRTRRQTPLQVAIAKGFLTLTEDLLKGGASPSANGSALICAINHKRADIVALLLNRGAAVDQGTFGWACSSGDPQVIRVFLENGADPIKGFPFYHALIGCLKPVLGLYRTYAEKVPEVRVQGDMALCHFAKEGNLRCVSLLLWAGARPDKGVPYLRKPEDDFLDECALVAAARSGHLDVLKRLKPENYPELHVAIVEACWHHNSKEILDFLRKIGAQSSFEPAKSSEALGLLFWQLGLDADPKSPFGASGPTAVEGTLQRIEYLVEKGAKWLLDPAGGFRSARSTFKNLKPEDIYRLLVHFKKHQAISDQTIENLINTTKLRAQIGPKFSNAIHDLFHPPKVEAGNPTATVSAPSPTRPRLTLPQLKARAEDYFWEIVRAISSVSFWRSETWEDADTKTFQQFLGVDKKDEHPLFEIAQEAIARINRKALSFTLTLDGNEYRQSISRLKIRLNPDCEWREVLMESWKRVEHQTARFLTKPALELFSWLRDSGFPSEWTKDRTLAWKAGLRGKGGVVERYLLELRQKLGSNFRFESRGSRWGGTQEHRIWLEGEVSLEGPLPRPDTPRAVNPVIDLRLEDSNKQAFDQWKNFVHTHILETRPTATTPVYILWIDNRKELSRVLPRMSVELYGPGDKLAKFWNEVGLHPELTIGYDFRGEAEAWFLRVSPKSTWEMAIQAIEEFSKQPSLCEKYGLSPDAAKLLEWIESLQAKDLEGKWTPVVEDEQKKKIGLDCPWGNEHFSAYLQLLIEEINEKTPYALTLQPWRHHSEMKTKIRIGRKRSEESQLVRQLQLYGLQKGKFLGEEQIRNLLIELFNSPVASITIQVR